MWIMLCISLKPQNCPKLASMFFQCVNVYRRLNLKVLLNWLKMTSVFMSFFLMYSKVTLSDKGALELQAGPGVDLYPASMLIHVWHSTFSCFIKEGDIFKPEVYKKSSFSLIFLSLALSPSVPPPFLSTSLPNSAGEE